MGHKAACVAKQHMQLRKSAVDFSQLLTVEVEGCLNFSDFFLYFLDLGFSQEFIASDQKQGNKILMTSSATMGLNFWSKIGSPIPMTSQWPQTASFLAVSNMFPSFWSELYWSDQKEGNPMLQIKEKGTLSLSGSDGLIWGYLILYQTPRTLVKNEVTF